MNKNYELPIVIGGVRFKNPFFVASGPTTKSVEQLVKIEECGWAAASIKLSIDPAPYVNRYPRYAMLEDRNALAFTAEKRLTFEEGLTLVKEAKKVLKDLILFANITYAGENGVSGWVNMAVEFEKAGADIIELNMCCPNMSFNMQLTSGDENASDIKTGASLGQNGNAIVEIVKEIKKAIKIPLFVKLTPEGGNIAPIAKQLFEAGADAVGSAGNRLGLPIINIEDPGSACYHLQEEISMSCHCGAWLKPLAQRDTYEIRKLAGKGGRIMATGGIRNAKDAIEMVMCGGDLLGVCSETLIRGYDFIKDVIIEMKQFMESNGYADLESMRDALVNKVKSAQELTIYKGYAKVKNPQLSAPCKIACPLHVPVQAYIKKIAKKEYKEAFDLITQNNPLQSICGYVCNHKCEDACIRGQAGKPLPIKELKKFVLEMGEREGWKPKAACLAKRKEKIAVIGSGAAGLSCAYTLAQAGYEVTVFEKEKQLGGFIRLALPSYIIPQELIDKEIKLLESMGVCFKTETELGRNISLAEIKQQGYNAIFLATGAYKQVNSKIKNQQMAVNSLYFLMGVKNGQITKIPSKIVVIGADYLAVDCARSARRLGAKEVFIVHSKEENSIAVPKEQLALAKEEGVKILSMTSAVSVLSEKAYTVGVELENSQLKGHTFTIPCDLVIDSSERTCENSFDAEMTDGFIQVDKKTMATSIEDVYAGGDAVCLNSFVWAVASGKRAAVSIDKQLARHESSLEYDKPLTASNRDTVLKRAGYFKDTNAINLITRKPDDRLADFETYSRTMTEEEAVSEASRCLGCGCGEGCQVCKELCCEFAIDIEQTDTIKINKNKCVACGMCYRMCPNKNIEMVNLNIPI